MLCVSECAKRVVLLLMDAASLFALYCTTPRTFETVSFEAFYKIKTGERTSKQANDWVSVFCKYWRLYEIWVLIESTMIYQLFSNFQLFFNLILVFQFTLTITKTITFIITVSNGIQTMLVPVWVPIYLNVIKCI